MKENRLPLLMLILALVGMGVTGICRAGIFPKTVRGSGNVVEENREVSDFNKVHLSGIGNLKIELGDKEHLRIEAEDNLLPHIETEVRGNSLIIEIENRINLDPTRPINYYLTVTDLDAISISGSGTAEAPRLKAEQFSVGLSGSASVLIHGVDSDSIKLDISGSGSIEIGRLDTESLEADISGSGDVSINGGKADRQEIGISGSGKYNAKNLESAEANVDLSGSASLVLRVSDLLKADINGAGSVKYIGNPKIDADISGQGKIKQIEE